jgi:predicted O-linked N-acetylglucosamine transferase (SPINDLY family)
MNRATRLRAPDFRHLHGKDSDMSASPQHASEAAVRQAASAPTDDACQRAMNLQIGGALRLAEEIYRAILQAEPRHATANYCLGMLHVQLKRPVEGLSYLMAALEASPAVPDHWLGYLEALLAADRTEEARQTLALAREHGLAGSATEDFAGRLQVKLSQTSAPPVLGAPAAARIERRQASRAARREETALLGALRAGNWTEVEARARALIERFPDRGLAFKTLGAVLAARGSLGEAVDAMKRSVALLPEDAEARANLGSTLIKHECYEEAESILRQALQLDPKFTAAYVELADAYQAQGRYVEAQEILRRSLSIGPDPAEPDEDLRHTSFLFLLSHDPALDADSLFAEHCRIGARLESRARASRPRFPNLTDPQRRLRVGLVSADFCNHAVTNFLEPILSRLTRCAGLELHAYYNNPAQDAVTQRLRGYMHHWTAVSALPDRQVARKIMDDRIDILLDLSGHTSLNRLRVFARRAAPIQVSWMGYPGTTGLRAMDYYLADRHFLPPGQFDRQFTEKLVYLPAGAPFQPDPDAPPIATLPALRHGRLTFGSFNRIGKINAATVALWSQLLIALPDSSMLIAGIPPASHQSRRLMEWFAAHGVSAERLSFHPRCNMDAYLARHHEVDLCLDTFPYSGGTTTYHALWMGVPTLTIAGLTPASRQGAAIFELLDLSGFIAADAADFVAKGIHWAHQLAALAAVRAGLRERALSSSVCDPEVVAEAFIRATRHMWKRWCNGLAPESFEIDAPEFIGGPS